MWDAVAASGLPVHFHTKAAGCGATLQSFPQKVALAARAAGITTFQMYMSEYCCR